MYGNADVDVDPERGQEGRDLGPERVHPEAGQGADEDRAREGRRRGTAVEGGLLDEVRLVERDEPRLVAGAELVEDGLDRGPVLSQVRIRGIDDLDQDIGPVDLLERRPERVDELVRELVDEAHRVGDDRGLAVAELHLARRGIERREQLVLGLRDLAADERVQEGRLAGVRVADDADRREHAADRGRGPPSGAAGGRARPAPSSSRSGSG